MAGMQSKNWIFTWNNPEFELHLGTRDFISYLVYQKERGENGTVHYQGYLETSRRVRLSQLKDIHQGIHWEVRRGSQAQAIAYATKCDTRIDGPWEYGEKFTSNQGRRNDLLAVADRIRDGSTFETISDEFPAESIQYRRSILDSIRANRRSQHKRVIRQDLEVYVYWGDSGAGKTRSVYETEGIENVYTLTECHNGTVWFDDYDYEPVLLIDDFRGWIKFTMLLKILDIYPLRIPIKGSFENAAWKKVYITSNHPIEDWYRTESGHCLSALRRRIHRVVHFSIDHPWQPEPSVGRDLSAAIPTGDSTSSVAGDEAQSAESTVTTSE